MTVPKVYLKLNHAQTALARHPWVYAGGIARLDGTPDDGDEVDVTSPEGAFIARGLWNGQSKIRVRLYRWEPGAIDREFFLDRFRRAVELREMLGLRGQGQGCRLVFSEADGVSGLRVDEYAGWLTVQFAALGLARRREMIGEVLNELVQSRGIYLRTEKGVGQLEGLTLGDGLLSGDMPPADLSIDEGGVSFLVNIAEGQKTGFYHDQRNNRLAAAKFAKGRRVLDAFCYTGGFGLHAAKAGALSVECVDVSEPALMLGRRNVERNGLSNVAFVKSDVFRFLDAAAAESRKYGLIVLDPPKFARTRSAIPDALRGYRQLLKQGLRLTETGGMVVFCCCSGLVSMEALTELAADVAGEEKRDVQILDRRGAAADHPVSVNCLETSYLKVLFLRLR